MTKIVKQALREHTLQKRDEVPLDVKRQWDQEIFDKVNRNPDYQRARKIFIFVSFGSEVNTHAIIKHALAHKKEVYVPKIVSKKEGMQIRKITQLQELEKGYFGVLEPPMESPIGELEEMDLIFMPGVAFDKKGGRLGYGGGFYDRALASLSKKIPTLALTYTVQIVEKVPMESFDHYVADVITND